MNRVVFALLCAVSAWNPSTFAGILFGVEDSTDQLVTVDSATAQVTAIGPLGGGFQSVVGLTFDDQGTLFGVDFGVDKIVSIDTHTGAASEFASLENLTLEGNFASVAYRPGQGLVTADRTTGEFFQTDSSGSTAPLSLTPIVGASGMVFESAEILLVSDILSDSITRINFSLGTREEFAHGFDLVNSLTIDANGRLLGIDLATQQLLDFGITSQLGSSSVTVVGSTDGVIDALAANTVPEPAAAGIFSVMLIGFGLSRRRRRER